MSVTFFAHNYDQLPTFMRVGDIIRIHRANIGSYKNYKTFSVNLAFGSSWVIFSGFVDSPPPMCLNYQEHGVSTGQNNQIKSFYQNGVATEEDHKDSGALYRVKPFKASSKEYSLSSNDFEIVNSYRKWLAEYFENEFSYEATLFMNLTKVKEFIANESSSLPKGATTFSYPREYDLVVRVDSIQTVESNELARKVLTGGKQAEVKVSIKHDESNGGKGVREEQTEETKRIKISDSAQV